MGRTWLVVEVSRALSRVGCPLDVSREVLKSRVNDERRLTIPSRVSKLLAETELSALMRLDPKNAPRLVELLLGAFASGPTSSASATYHPNQGGLQGTGKALHDEDGVPNLGRPNYSTSIAAGCSGKLATKVLAKFRMLSAHALFKTSRSVPKNCLK